ncbi:MAG: AAA family ATPase [Akkermansiaceae bacterium]|nr:AAA family ATPase [Akkermansiaceae bacterium]
MPKTNVRGNEIITLMATPLPNLIILAGPNGSGKTTFASLLLQHPWGKDCINLNADALAEELGGWNDTECIIKAQQQIREQLNNAIEAKQDIIYETVFSHPSKLDIIHKARSLGYFVRLFFICTESPRINIDRVADRFAKGGHAVPGNKVNDRYSRALMYGAEAMRLVQRGYLYDNSLPAAPNRDSFKLIFRTINGVDYKLYSPLESLPGSYAYFLSDFIQQ